MTPIRFDHLPGEMTAGEIAALLDADDRGWIVPPCRDTLRPEPTRTWRTADLRYLERRRLIGERRYRLDGLFDWRLNEAGMALRDRHWPAQRPVAA